MNKDLPHCFKFKKINQSCLLRLRHFAAQSLGSLQSETRKGTSNCTSRTVSFKKLMYQSCLFRLRHFAAHRLGTLHSIQRKNELYPQNRRHFKQFLLDE